MKCAGIVAEYNPFHNGHRFHIEKTREELNADYIIAVMSGNFVQRGEPAMFDKWSRTKWALENGVDMVLELPVIYSLATAERFAFGAVATLNACGLIDTLSFGAETADIALLEKTADTTYNEPEALQEAISQILKTGASYPRARKAALVQTGYPSEMMQIFDAANCILGMEYIRAIHKLQSPIKPYAIERAEAAHDSAAPSGHIASALTIRKTIQNYSDMEACKQYVPESVYAQIQQLTASGSAPVTLDNCSELAIYALRRASLSELAALPDVKEGFENALYQAARSSATFSAFLSAAKSKRYTMARIKRICMSLLIGITASDVFHSVPEYIRVLGIKKESIQLLSMLNDSARLPVIVNKEDEKDLGVKARRMRDLDIFSSEVYSLLTPGKTHIFNDYTQKFITV